MQTIFPFDFSSLESGTPVQIGPIEVPHRGDVVQASCLMTTLTHTRSAGTSDGEVVITTEFAITDSPTPGEGTQYAHARSELTQRAIDCAGDYPSTIDGDDPPILGAGLEPGTYTFWLHHTQSIRVSLGTGGHRGTSATGSIKFLEAS